MQLQKKIVTLLIYIVLPATSLADSSWFVVLYGPGTTWQSKEAFDGQPGIDRHNDYLEGLMAQGQLILGGPFDDAQGAMIVLKTPDRQAALDIANGDPSVRSGELSYELRSWKTPWSVISIPRERKTRPVIAKDSPFKLGSPQTPSPINLEKNE